MSFPIPKIEWKNLSTTGTTDSGNGEITGIPDTSEIEVGMFVKGTGIPAGAVVGSKTASTITLASSVLATADGTGIALTFGFALEFDFPPKEPTGEALETNAVVSASLSGIRQVSVNHIEAIRKPVFSFLSPTIFSTLNTFLTTHALNGEAFRYFEDKTLTDYVEYELDSFKIAPKKIAPRSATTYVWEVPLSFRRVV